MQENSLAITKVNQGVYAKARLSRDPRFDGQFFVAVKTTGIFCRPICPAKLPKEENVTYFTHATTAMAQGFRPCYRCRPDSAPQSSAWEGVNTTLSRAMKLLSALPIQSVAHISSRLGISERYLNKLMISAVGISPKQFQNMQRALFAKQLIQQSALSFTDIAHTASYDSLRQLQRAIAQYCNTTPSALRKTKAAAHNDITLFLSYRPPYDWAYVRAFLSMRAIAGMENVTENSYQRWFNLQDDVGYVRVEHVNARNGFAVTINIPDLSHLHSIIENIKGMLDLNADPVLIKHSLVQAGLSENEVLSGIRLPSAWSVFESGCRAILGQQVSVKAAIGQVSLLVHTLGAKAKTAKTDKPDTIHTNASNCSVSGENAYCFPTPESVALADLRFLRMPDARRETLRRFAQLFSENSSPDHSEILALKGVGSWTLDYIKMRGERQPDVYLEGDLIVRKMAALHPVEPEQAAPWRSYLTLQLWKLSDNTQGKIKNKERTKEKDK